MRLNLGCGWDVRDGYVNVDFAAHHSPDVVADVFRVPFRSAVAEEVLAQDVLEHLPRTATLEALTEWHRVLAPGGRIHARFPSLLHAADLMRRRNDLATHRLLLQNLYGTQAYTGDVHLTSFTDLTVAADFHAAGFRNVVATVVDEWMWDVWATARTAAVPVAVFWTAGVYQPENDGASQWNWIDSRAEIDVINTGDAPASMQFVAEVGAAHDPGGALHVQVGDEVREFGHGERVLVRFSASPRERTQILLDAHFSRVEAPLDARQLFCQLIEAEISPQQ